MRIVFGTTASQTVLCEGAAGNQFPERLSISHQEAVDIKQPIRATKAKTYGRGNTQMRVSWLITREHANHAAALAFAFRHHGTLPKTGTVWFIAETNEGERTEYKLEDACLASTVLDPIIGCSTVHRYEISGGDIS
jgi:hypothetical protein